MATALLPTIPDKEVKHMKDFLEPKLNVLLFRIEDIITDSTPIEGDDGVVLPPDEFNN
jgi:hypothetical protein